MMIEQQHPNFEDQVKGSFMAFNRNNLEGMSGMGPRVGADHFAWTTQFNNMGRKTNPDLSPGGGRRKVMMMDQAKKNKVYFGEDEDSEPSIYFNNQTLFRPDKEMFSSSNQQLFHLDKELMTSPSPSQLNLSANFYGQPSGMGNVSLQQRSLNNSQFPRTSTGHITPTSGIGNFPLSMQQQQSSPNRSMFSTVGGQRPFMNQPANSQSIPLQKRSNSISGASGGGHLGFTQFGPRGQDQASLDLSEFPTLGNRSSTTPNPMPAVRNYVNMVSKPASEQTPEFTIQQEDFPALPGSMNPPTSNASDGTKPLTSTSGSSYEQAVSKEGNKLFPALDKMSTTSTKRMIQTHADGMVSNIPLGMVMDQFGMVGLLTFIRAAETDPNLVALAPGIDLTTLGLNLNSPETLYSTFQSPWADAPCRPQDIDFHVPSEYLTNLFIRDKLAPIKLNRYGEDLLFFLFYMNGGDVLQLAAAAELYNRDWRYHKEERVWITRAPGMDPIVKTSAFERGTYYFFDVTNWRKVPKEFHLEYDKLEERPHLPTTLHHNPAPTMLSH